MKLKSLKVNNHCFHSAGGRLHFFSFEFNILAFGLGSAQKIKPTAELSLGAPTIPLQRWSDHPIWHLSVTCRVWQQQTDRYGLRGKAVPGGERITKVTTVPEWSSQSKGLLSIPVIQRQRASQYTSYTEAEPLDPVVALGLLWLQNLCTICQSGFSILHSHRQDARVPFLHLCADTCLLLKGHLHFHTIFIAALFTVAKKQKPYKCPLVGDWMKKLWN